MGGGEVAERKAERLLECGAKVVVIGRELTPRLMTLAGEGKVKHIASDYDDQLIKDAYLVIGATDDAAVNETIRKKANREGILINIVDDLEKCDFILPSIYQKGNLQIAVSTGGASPALAKRIRLDLERIYGEEYGIFLRLLADLRKKVLKRGLPPNENKALFESVVNSDVLDLIREKKWEEVRRTVLRLSGEEIDPREL